MRPGTPLRRRGQPLLALALLMTSWIGARAAMWEAPLVKPVAARHSIAQPLAPPQPPPSAVQRSAPASPPANTALRPPGQPAARFDAPLPQPLVPQLPEPQLSPVPAALLKRHRRHPAQPQLLMSRRDARA